MVRAWAGGCPPRRRQDGRRRDGDDGLAAVELALVLIPLLVVLLGMVEVGRAYAMQFRLQQAARDTARDIALQFDDPSLTSPIDDVADDTLDQALGSWTGDVVRTLVYCTTADPPPTPHVAVVTLRLPLDLAIPVPDAPLSTEIVGHARMPCEG